MGVVEGGNGQRPIEGLVLNLCATGRAVCMHRSIQLSKVSSLDARSHVFG